MSPGTLVRSARHAAGLTQSELAQRMKTTQSAIARLERDRGNPTFRVMEDAVHAAGFTVDLTLVPRPPGVDESLIRQHLERTPAQRLDGIASMYKEARALTLVGERHRGELA